MTQTVTYEQPLSEIIRVCLRLEQLFQQIDHQLNDMSTLGTRNVITCLINVLHLLDRPDLKSKLAKELSSHLTNVMRQHNASIDGDNKKYQEVAQQLEESARSLIDSSGKIGHRLRDIELLNSLRLHLATAGGGCSFDIPLYHYWLQLPAQQRHATIVEWLNDFSPIRSAITLVLDLIRKNAKIEQKTAVHGFHQELLDPQSNLRMICIGMGTDIPAYPEFSIGRHFLSVRFFVPDIENRPVQYTENLLFWLSYCSL